MPKLIERIDNAATRGARKEAAESLRSIAESIGEPDMPDTELAKRTNGLAELIARLQNPPWIHDRERDSFELDVEQTLQDMREAAAALSAARAEIDEAFAEGRKSAWSAARAEAMREVAEKVRNMQRHYEQYLQKYPDEQLTAVRAALCESLAKQLAALAAGQGGENG